MPCIRRRPPPEKLPEASRVTYHTNAPGIDQSRNWIGGPVNDGLRRARLAELGVDCRRIRGGVRRRPTVQSMNLVGRDREDRRDRTVA